MGSVSQKTKAMEQHIRFCQAADGVNIAYATSGFGPPIVRVGKMINFINKVFKVGDKYNVDS